MKIIYLLSFFICNSNLSNVTALVALFGLEKCILETVKNRMKHTVFKNIFLVTSTNINTYYYSMEKIKSYTL